MYSTRRLGTLTIKCGMIITQFYASLAVFDDHVQHVPVDLTSPLLAEGFI